MSEEAPGEDDGPSRPGHRLRRVVIVVISGLLLICTPVVVWTYWGMAHPGPGPFSSRTPSEPYSPPKLVATVSMTVTQADEPRFIEALDRFALGRGLAGDRHLTRGPFWKSSIVHLVYKDAQTEIRVRNSSSEPDAFVVEFYELPGAGAEAGQRLKASFDDKVIRAGGFGP
jgi:hypothetical protein